MILLSSDELRVGLLYCSGFCSRRLLGGAGTGRHSLTAPRAAARRSKQPGMLQWLRDYETGGRRQPTPIRRRFLRQQYTTLVTVLGHFQAVYSAEFDHTGERSTRVTLPTSMCPQCTLSGEGGGVFELLVVCVCRSAAGDGFRRQAAEDMGHAECAADALTARAHRRDHHDRT